MLIPPLQYSEITIGEASLRKIDSDFFSLTVKGSEWMSYNLRDYTQMYQQLLEAEIGKGDCVITGLGLGIITLILAKKEEVTSVTVYEKSLDIIKMFYFFCEKNSIPQNILQKIRIIEQDANTMVNQYYDYGFFDHFEQETPTYIINTVRNISLNNSIKNVWFWPAGSYYLLWCEENNHEVNCYSLCNYISSLQIKNIFNDINPLTLYFIIFGYQDKKVYPFK